MKKIHILIKTHIKNLSVKIPTQKMQWIHFKDIVSKAIRSNFIETKKTFMHSKNM